MLTKQQRNTINAAKAYARAIRKRDRFLRSPPPKTKKEIAGNQEKLDALFSAVNLWHRRLLLSVATLEDAEKREKYDTFLCESEPSPPLPPSRPRGRRR